MYKIIVNGSEFTIPKQNIRALALSKAVELSKRMTEIKNSDQAAIDFLKILGIKVEEL